MLRYEIQCALPDHTDKKNKDATHWITVDWAFTQAEANEKRDLWIKKGEVKVFDTQRPPREDKRDDRRGGRSRNRDRDRDDY